MDTAADSPRIFVVLEQNPIIAADLIDTLNAAFECRVIHVTSTDSLPAAVRDIHAVSAAFLELSGNDPARSDLMHLLQERGAALILTMGEAAVADQLPDGMIRLPRPFTDKMVLEALGQVTCGVNEASSVTEARP